MTLGVDRLESSDVPNHTRITGNKGRSGGKNIFDELPNNIKDSELISAVSALKTLRQSVGLLKLNVPESEQRIFTYCKRGKLVNGIFESAYRTEFASLCKRSEILRHLKIVPSMIRPSVLLLMQLEDPSNSSLVTVKAHHESESTTAGYTNKLPYRVVMEQEMLKFQSTMEIILLTTSNQMEEKEKKARLGAARKTGLGVFCKNNEIEDDNGGKSTCTEVQNCHSCKHGRMMVSADVESISDMIIWREALDRNEQEWLSRNPLRWEKVWVPWQAFMSVVLDEKMARGKLSFIKKQALELAVGTMKKTEFRMPVPW